MMTDTTPTNPPLKSKRADARMLARLAAVQALYQMEHSGIGVEAVIREFVAHRLGGELEGETIRVADEAFFANLLRGVIRTQRDIDPFIEKYLREGWTLRRLDATARAILRAALYELLQLREVPARVAMDVYIDLTSSFFDQGTSEPKFINAVLDGCARQIRPDELLPT